MTATDWLRLNKRLRILMLTSLFSSNTLAYNIYYHQYTSKLGKHTRGCQRPTKGHSTEVGGKNGWGILKRERKNMGKKANHKWFHRGNEYQKSVLPSDWEGMNLVCWGWAYAQQQAKLGRTVRMAYCQENTRTGWQGQPQLGDLGLQMQQGLPSPWSHCWWGSRKTHS